MAKNKEEFQTITATLVLDGAAKAIDTYRKAFGAQEVYRMDDGKGKIMHACLTIGNSKIFLCDTNPQMGTMEPTRGSFYLYKDDVDAAFKQARSSGLKELFAPQDMFWGDRTGVVEDGFGIRWTLATHVRDVSPEEMEEGRKKFAAGKKAA